MTQNSACHICNQPFNSERDLQEHQRNVHNPSEGEKPLPESDLRRKCALVIGNEAHGVSAPWRSGVAGVSIPTAGVESLNAAVAAGILLYEAQRQRLQP